MPHTLLYCQESSSVTDKLTTGYTIEGIICQNTRNVRRSSPDKEHDGGSEGEKDQGIDGSDLLSSDQGKDST